MGGNSLAIFVICHGAWDGGWYWLETASHLQKLGHEVYTPTYTGLGERVHLAIPEITLETHIQDIINVIHYEKLNNIILVGHSYGGAVATGVAERIPEKIWELVYVDALIPNNGDSVVSLFGDHSPVVGQLIEMAEAHGDGWKIPFTFEGPFDPRQTPHPLRTFLQELKVTNPIAKLIPCTFIACTERGNDPTFEPIEAGAQLAKQKGWHYYEIETGHNPNETEPVKTAEILHT